MIAKVIINVPSGNVDQEYEYLIPETMTPFAKAFTRVKVPFGNSDRLLMGYIIEIDEASEHLGNLKEIKELVDLEPVITETQYKLALYIKEDTICPLIRVLNLLVPDVLQLKTTKYLTINDYNLLDADLALIFGGKEVIEYTSALNAYASKIKKALDRGIISISYDAIRQDRHKLVDKYIVNERNYFTYMNELKPDKAQFLERLRGMEPKSISELVDFGELSLYMIKALIKKEYLDKIQVQVSRIKVRDIAITNRFVKPSPIYDETVSEIQSSSEHKLPILWIPEDINETEIVLERCVRDNVNKDLNTVIICPDILSSFRYASIIRKKTGLSVACLNSTLSKGEYFDYYQEIINNEYRVIVTTPKASLLAYPKVGTVILMDAESDNYYNDQSPRYDLKKVMYMSSKYHEYNYAIHSYSPNMIEFVDGIKGLYKTIDHRKETNESRVEVADLRSELLKGNNSPISSKLVKKMKLTLANHQQVLLIINNKGYSSYVMCRSCGEIIKCSRCEIAMQYSKKTEQLICPACANKQPMTTKCPVCGSEELRLQGQGMEKVEEEIKELFPDNNIVTIADSTYEEFCDKMNDVEEGLVDIIIATDVFSRSVIDKNIQLIGIMNIDAIAGGPSYNAAERAYNLLVHANQHLRNKENAEMLIQAYDPKAYYLATFITGNFKEYIKNAISNYRKLRNEPFYKINRILVKGKFEEMFKEAYDIKKTILQLLEQSIYVIGPTYNKKDQAVQLIVKHQFPEINKIYQNIYRKYQTTTMTIIFDKYPRYL